MSDFKEPTTTLLDQLMKKSNQWNACDFDFPVDSYFGYAYDADTERLYVAGGVKDGNNNDKLYEIELMKDASSSSLCPRIVRTFDLPHGRGILGCVCVKLHNKLYVIGGCDGYCNYLNDVYGFDTTIGTWEKAASMNTERYLHSVVLTKRGTIMVCGGQGNSFKNLDNCEEYSDLKRQWTTLPCRLREARYGHVSICHESRVVVIGGFNDCSAELATTEVMDLDSSNPQWNYGPGLVEERCGAASSILGDYVVIAGGWNGNERLRSLEAIATRDLADGIGEWRLLSGCEMNKPQHFFGMALVDGCLLSLSGCGTANTCEMLDVSILLANAPFYERLLQQYDRYTMEHRLETLATVVRNAHEAKIFYTYARQCIRHGLVDSSQGSDILKSCLQQSIESCICEDAVDLYMMTLDKAEADLLLVSQKDALRQHALTRYTTQAGTKPQKKRDPTFVNNMQKTVGTNMQLFGGVGHGVETLHLQVQMLQDKMKRVRESLLEHQHGFLVGQSSWRQGQQNVDRVNESIHALKRHRSEAVALFITSVLNVIAIGVDGSLTEGFEKFLARAVDFGDPMHMLGVLNFCLEKPESEELGDVYSTMKKQFERGVELAMKESRNELADAIKEGDALVALGAVATLANGNDTNEGLVVTRGNKEDTHAATITTAEIPDTFRDSILSEDDEEKCPIHASVKYADMDTLKEFLQEEDYVLSINTQDSEGRTCLDLAALTGQLDMVQVLTCHGAEYTKFKSVAGMKFVAKSRRGKHDEYLEYLYSLV